MATHPSNTPCSDTARQPEEPLPLPEPSSATTVPTLNVSTGEGVKLDHLGPMVVNRDGTLSRVANWEQMSEVEKKNTLRILGKRNQLRMQALKDKEIVAAQPDPS